MRSEGTFFDDKHFPRGFNRSGDFTISEANLLTKYGCTMNALYEKRLAPVAESETRFVNEISGQQEVTSDYAKCWIKYLNKTQTKSITYTLCGTQHNSNVNYNDPGIELD